ncbi:MAG: IspD/TarI family cytidylyltransferase [Nocardioidaceae bacterium]
MPSHIAAIIPAAGLGLRLGGGTAQASSGSVDAQPSLGDSSPPKALKLLAGQSLVRRAAATLTSMVDQLVVAVPADWVGQVEADLSEGVGVPVVVVPGGATRQQSVQLALAAVAADTEWVLVHDAARPLVPAAVVRRVVAGLRHGANAVIPTIAVADSLRQTLDSGASVPLDRTRVHAVQTPQGFCRAVLTQAHRRATGGDASDDATLVEQCGVEVAIVAGDELAFKITRPIDLALAETILKARAAT